MQSSFILISTILALISPIIYTASIIKGKSKPHRTTRFTILLTTVIATISLFAQHNTVAIWLSGVSALQAIVIFILSVKYGMGGWAKSDLSCLFLALTGIVLWKTTGNPSLALFFSIFADFTGMIPALMKTYRLPHTETWIFYAMDTFAGLFSLMATGNWTISEISYPIYIIIINLMMFILIITPRRF